MTDAQGKKEGICAGLALVHEPPWDGGSTDTQGYRHTDTRTRTNTDTDTHTYTYT